MNCSQFPKKKIKFGVALCPIKRFKKLNCSYTASFAMNYYNYKQKKIILHQDILKNMNLQEIGMSDEDGTKTFRANTGKSWCS